MKRTNLPGIERGCGAPLPDKRIVVIGKVIATLLILLFFVSVLWLVAQEAQRGAGVREIRMTARKYRFDPKEIRVREGERVRLLITALDRKHGIRIKEFGVKTVLEEGKETVVEFVAERAGEYKFKCSVRCGLRHGSMKGNLIVEPAEKPGLQGAE